MGRCIVRSSIIIPLAIIYYIMMAPVTISIPEIGLYLGRALTTFFCITLTVVWLCCSPFRKSCCNGRMTEAMYNLVPVEVVSMLIFAQWHFGMAIVVAILIIAAEILLFMDIGKAGGYDFMTNKRGRRYDVVFQRCSVFIYFVLTVIPCILSVAVYNFRSPIHEADEEVWNTIFSDSGAAEEADSDDQYVNHEELLNCFAESRWESFSAAERITIVQELVDFESEQLGIPSVPVTAEKLNAYTLGQYSSEEDVMWIDIEHLMESSAEDVVTTICHETYHSAQNYLVENLDWDNDVFQSSYFAELRSWKDNRDNYKDAEVFGYDAYEEQPLEVSARQYAEDETGVIFSYIYDE